MQVFNGKLKSISSSFKEECPVCKMVFNEIKVSGDVDKFNLYDSEEPLTLELHCEEFSYLETFSKYKISKNFEITFMEEDKDSDTNQKFCLSTARESLKKGFYEVEFTSLVDNKSKITATFHKDILDSFDFFKKVNICIKQLNKE